MGTLPYLDTLLRLLTAAALGSLIGFERERLLWAGRNPNAHASLRWGLLVYDCIDVRILHNTWTERRSGSLSRRRTSGIRHWLPWRRRDLGARRNR